MIRSLVGKRPSFVLWACLWGIGAAIPLVAIGVDLLDPSRLPGRDFLAFWTAGHLNNPYDPAWLASTSAPFVSPPPSLLLLAPLGQLPYGVALVLWTLGGAALFAWAARPHAPFPLALAVLTPAALLNVWDGQFGFFAGAIWLAAFRFGPAAGLLVIKPQLGLLLVPRLLADRRALVGALLVAALLSLATWPLWQGFFRAAASHAAFATSAPDAFFFQRPMPSAYAAYGQSWLAQALFATAAVGLLARRKSTDCFALATATFLIVPYVHSYDMTVACLGFAILLYRDWVELGNVERTALSLAFLSPALTFVAAWAVPPILLAALAIQLGYSQSAAVRARRLSDVVQG